MVVVVPRRIQDFPVELIKEVSKHTIPLDLLAFRAVCRRFKNGSDDVFLSTFFKKRVHLYSKHSLETLRSITEDKRLCEKVESICTIVQCPLWHDPPRYDDDDDLQSDEFNDEAIVDPYEMRNNTHAITTLVQTFTNLTTLKKSISLAVWSYTTSTIYGWSKLLQRHGIDGMEEGYHYSVWPRNPQAVAETVLHAVADSGLTLYSLDLGFEDDSFGMFVNTHCQRYRKDVNVDSHLLRSFSNLTVLKLGVGPVVAPEFEKWRFLDSMGSVVSISEILKTAIHLKELSVVACGRNLEYPRDAWREPDRWHQPLDFRGLKQVPLLPSLQKLELCWMQVWNEHIGLLQGFISRFSASLKHLALSKLVMDKRKHLAKLLDRIADTQLPLLQRVELFAFGFMDEQANRRFFAQQEPVVIETIRQTGNKIVKSVTVQIEDLADELWVVT